METAGPTPDQLVILRPRWILAVQGALVPSVAAGLVLGLASRRWWVGPTAIIIMVVLTARNVRRRSLTVGEHGFVAQRDAYQLIGQWNNVSGVRRRRIGWIGVDELLLTSSLTEPIDVRGQRRDSVPAKVAQVGADQRLQVSVYDKDWATGPIGRALSANGTAPTPAAPWDGRPSGEAFADKVRAIGRQEGISLQVQVEPYMVGGYSVWIDWEGARDGLLCQVVDWSGDVAVLDPHQESLAADLALDLIRQRLRSSSSEHHGGDRSSSL